MDRVICFKKEAQKYYGLKFSFDAIRAEIGEAIF